MMALFCKFYYRKITPKTFAMNYGKTSRIEEVYDKKPFKNWSKMVELCQIANNIINGSVE